MFKDSIKTGDVVIALYKLSHVQILSLKNSNFVTDTIQSFIYESFYIGGILKKILWLIIFHESIFFVQIVFCSEQD